VEGFSRGELSVHLRTKELDLSPILNALAQTQISPLPQNSRET
jgi:hypothetical protein